VSSPRQIREIIVPDEDGQPSPFSNTFVRFVRRIATQMQEAGLGTVALIRYNQFGMYRLELRHGRYLYETVHAPGYETDVVSMDAHYNYGAPFTKKDWLTALETCNDLAIISHGNLEIKAPYAVNDSGCVRWATEGTVNSPRQVGKALIECVAECHYRLRAWNLAFSKNKKRREALAKR
jgi:hypothetical protein